MTTATLRARVDQAQVLAAAATPGPWRSEGDTMTGGMDFRYVMVPLPVGTSVASGIIARCQRFGTHAHEAAANADMMAAAPDLVALIGELWAAYTAACDRADGRDRLEADVRRLTAERDTAWGAEQRAAGAAEERAHILAHLRRPSSAEEAAAYLRPVYPAVSVDDLELRWNGGDPAWTWRGRIVCLDRDVMRARRTEADAIERGEDRTP